MLGYEHVVGSLETNPPGYTDTRSLVRTLSTSSRSRQLDPDQRSLFSNDSKYEFTRKALTDKNICTVFRFFVSHVGVWVRFHDPTSLHTLFQPYANFSKLDIASPRRYFQATVPKLALDNRTLFYACLTCAGRTLVQQGLLDTEQYGEYENQAISALIPELSNVNASSDIDSLLTTAVILRMAEQFSEVEDDQHCHLTGASSLFIGGAPIDTPAYWVYVRQSIRAAFLKEEPCKLEGLSLEVDFTKGGEETWANQATSLLARICTACWTPSLEPTARLDQLAALGKALEEWRLGVPRQFQPWCEYRTDEDPFPVISYISAWHGKSARRPKLSCGSVFFSIPIVI